MLRNLYKRYKHKHTPQKASDALAYIIDFSKHKRPDGTYEIVVYEVQHIIDSNIFLTQPWKNIFTHCEIEAGFFNRLMGKTTYHIDYKDTHCARNVNVGEESFHPNPAWRGFHRKFVQRMYFNVNADLQAYMPETTFIRPSDLEDDAALDVLLKGVCERPFVVKIDRCANGSGNAFFPGLNDKDSLKKAIQSHLDGSIAQDQHFILVERQRVTAPTPGKNHHDIYRAVCAHSNDLGFFNAQVITQHQVDARVFPDSHAAFERRVSYYYGGPHTLKKSSGGARIISTGTISKKRKRNLDLKKKKPALFSELKKIADEIAKISGEPILNYKAAMETTREEHNTEQLTFGKITFASIKTRDDAFKHLNILMCRLTPDTGVKIKPSPFS